jgi:hypothetical protein
MPRWSAPIVIDGKQVGIMCGSSPTRHCSSCGKRAAYQCDYPVVRKGKGHTTCDRWLCRGCATGVGPDRDYCPAHAREHVPDQQTLPGLAAAPHPSSKR